MQLYPKWPRGKLKNGYTKDEKGNKIKDKDGKPIYEDIKVPGRDLGAMISILTVAVQQLTDKVEALEAKWSQKT
jgi:hypothetical protein